MQSHFGIFGNTSPTGTSWVKRCSADSFFNPPRFWLLWPITPVPAAHFFLTMEPLHIPGLWLQSHVTGPTSHSASVLPFPHSSETPLTFFPAVPKIVCFLSIFRGQPGLEPIAGTVSPGSSDSGAKVRMKLDPGRTSSCHEKRFVSKETIGACWHGSSASLVPDHTESQLYTLSQK